MLQNPVMQEFRPQSHYTEGTLFYFLHIQAGWNVVTIGRTEKQGVRNTLRLPHTFSLGLNFSYQQFTSDNNLGDKIGLKGWLKGGRTKVLLVFYLLFTEKYVVVKDKGKTIVQAPENEQIKVIIAEGH